MNNLIQLSSRHIGANSTQTVNARDLHAFLEVGKDYSTWIKDRIQQYGFTEGQDFASHLLPNFGEKGQGRPTKEYAISLDMAKELAMVERNDKGKQARQYFIECERRAKESAVLIPQSLPEALRLAADLADQKVQTEAALALAAPKAAAFDRIATADGGMCITNTAKSLKMRPKDLFNWLQAHQWIYRRPGAANWIAYQDRLQAGVLSHKVTTVERADGSEKVIEQVLVTPKGLARLAEVACAEPVPA